MNTKGVDLNTRAVTISQHYTVSGVPLLSICFAAVWIFLFYKGPSDILI